MKRFIFIFLVILIVIALIMSTVTIYGYITSKSDGRIVSQKALRFLKSHPNSVQVQQYLKDNKIKSQVTHDIPAPGSESITSVLEPRNAKMAAYITFKIFDVQKSWCGVYYDYFIIIYDRDGNFLENKKLRGNVGCFDF